MLTTIPFNNKADLVKAIRKGRKVGIYAQGKTLIALFAVEGKYRINELNCSVSVENRCIVAVY